MSKNLENRVNFSDEMLSIINSTGTFKGDQVKPISRSRLMFFYTFMCFYMFIVMLNYDDVSLAITFTVITGQYALKLRYPVKSPPS